MIKKGSIYCIIYKFDVKDIISQLLINSKDR